MKYRKTTRLIFRASNLPSISYTSKSVVSIPSPTHLCMAILSVPWLAESFPWLAGNALNEGTGEGITGTYRIIPSNEIPLVVKDLRQIPPARTMDSSREAKFTFTMLDERLIAPCMTINPPGSSIGLVANTGPVFASSPVALCIPLLGSTIPWTWLGKEVPLIGCPKLVIASPSPMKSCRLVTWNKSKNISLTLKTLTWFLGSTVCSLMVKGSCSGFYEVYDHCLLRFKSRTAPL